MTTDCFSVAGRIPVVGVVGGIGSGKSSVARWVAARHNVELVDADDLGHQVLRSDSVKTLLRNRFGSEIFDEHGEIVRGKLARLVFGEEESVRIARLDLEKIVHPAIEQRIVDVISTAVESGREAVLLDAAILLEAGWKRCCDAVIFVDAPEDVRWRRVQARNGWSQEEFHKRELSQLPLENKKLLCDVIISNSTDDDRGGKELVDFLRSRWSICCNRSPNSSQQLVTTSESLPP